MDLMTKINALIDQEYESAKSESTTYRELKRRLKKVEKDIAWGYPKIAAYVKERFQKLLDEELGGLMLE